MKWRRSAIGRAARWRPSPSETRWASGKKGAAGGRSPDDDDIAQTVVIADAAADESPEIEDLAWEGVAAAGIELEATDTGRTRPRACGARWRRLRGRRCIRS